MRDKTAILWGYRGDTVRNSSWCPRSLAKLVNITPITKVYGLKLGGKPPGRTWGKKRLEEPFNMDFYFYFSFCCHMLYV